jgi:hypothetical protein
VPKVPEAPSAPKGLVVVAGWLDFIGALYFASQFCGGMDQCGETLGTDINLLAQVLQGHQGDFLFRFLAIQASAHISPVSIKEL